MIQNPSAFEQWKKVARVTFFAGTATISLGELAVVACKAVSSGSFQPEHTAYVRGSMILAGSFVIQSSDLPPSTKILLHAVYGATLFYQTALPT